MVTVSIAVCYVSQGNCFCLVQMEVTKTLLELRGMGTETVNDEELVLITAAEAEEATEAAKKRPCDDYHKYTHFTLNKYSDAEFKKFFHFEKKRCDSSG